MRWGTGRSRSMIKLAGRVSARRIVTFGSYLHSCYVNPQLGALIAQIIPIVALADVLAGSLRRFLDPAIAVVGRASRGLRVGTTDTAVRTVYLEARSRVALCAAILIMLTRGEASALQAAAGVHTSHAELIIAEVAILAGLLFAVVLPVFEEALTLLMARAPDATGYGWKRWVVLLVLIAGVSIALYPLHVWLS